MAGIEDSSPFSAMARAQYGALARLRWHMFTNSIRSTKGAMEVVARIIVFLLYGGIGLGMGIGAGSSSYLLASSGKWQYLAIVLWVVFVIWQVVPIMLASFQEQFDLSGLLRFPVNFPSFFLLYIVFGLVDVSTIVGTCCSLGILIGITLARSDLFFWTLLTLLAFGAFNVLMVRALFAWIDRWLAQRRTREILTGLFLLAVLSVNMITPMMQHRRERAHRSDGQSGQETTAVNASSIVQHNPWLRTANEVQKWLPPGLAAVALRKAGTQPTVAPALVSFGVLGLYGLLAGGVLLTRLRGEYRGENLGEAPKSKPSEKKVAADRAGPAVAMTLRATSAASGGSSSPIGAIVEKEFRALMRTMPLLYAVGAPLLLMVILSGTFLKGMSHSHVASFAVPICMVYALLGFTQLFYNNMGTEGAAVHLYFLSPTPFRTVMLAKNIFHASLFLGIAILGAVLATLRAGMPDIAVLAATGAWILFALPCNLAAGNIFSIIMPYRVNPGRISRQRGSQSNALLGLLVQLVVLGVGALGFWISWYYEDMWLATPIFLLLAAGAFLFWLRVLANSEAMAHKRKDALVATLVKTD